MVSRQLVHGQPYGPLRFEVEPGTVWKGAAAARVVIYSDQSSCGTDFEPGEEYLFILSGYPGFRSDSLVLGRCSGYHVPMHRADVLGLVKALYVPALRANLGAAGPRLNASEAEYFAGILPDTDFDFTNQQLGFFLDRQPMTKQQYLDRFLTVRVLHELVVFTPQERAAAGGYAAALVSWSKMAGRRKPISPKFRRRLVRRLAKAQPGQHLR
ncbi:hypothetical protein MTP16_16675 [Hymenobacter monticola]|uniref:DUF8192 domain-containing protein n=1 Tax=Hymenobacter monticola TaxID=1705399 RepID=A0ABY4B0U3_9BACT|nr:hypothetical protein [Hymenobacter monticola]UOE32757.1 hypothetical protein MTP16_16675 [Hymenobacter monticola]